MTKLLSAVAAVALLGATASYATPLTEAIQAGDREATLELLRDREAVNTPDPDGTTPLIWATHEGDADLVRRLIRARADVEAVNDYGATALGEAAVIGHAEIIDMLLREGADPNQTNPEGQTPLMAVARTGNVEAARLLVEAGADVNATEEWGGQTALIWAAAQGQPEMIAYLIGAGAEPDARATIRDWDRLVTAEPRGKDMDTGGLTALLYAAREGCAECARALVEGGADINLTDPNNISPLVMALLNMNYDAASYLISAGADVDKWDLWGRNPLYAAVDTNTLPMGGRTDLPSDDATTGPEVVAQLLEAGANPNLQLKLFPPYRAVGADRGGDGALTIGATPLHRAARGGDVESARLLLQHGANPDLPQVQGVTPLQLAAGIGHGGADTRGRFYTEAQALETIRALVEGGADPNARDLQGRTALHGAARKGWVQAIQLLVDLGSDVNAADNNDLTALDYAEGRIGLGPAGDVQPEAAAALQQLMGGDTAATDEAAAAAEPS
jgi:ankyrin repeat protein